MVTANRLYPPSEDALAAHVIKLSEENRKLQKQLEDSQSKREELSKIINEEREALKADEDHHVKVVGIMLGVIIVLGAGVFCLGAMAWRAW